VTFHAGFGGRIIRQRTHQPTTKRQGTHRVRGVITVVQEGRFGLLGEDGVHLLMQLSAHCPASIETLQTAQRQGTRVAVDCDDPKGVLVQRAHRIVALD